MSFREKTYRLSSRGNRKNYKLITQRHINRCAKIQGYLHKILSRAHPISSTRKVSSDNRQRGESRYSSIP
jgi:hypothetical protein